jgi:hypothetical protein
MTPEQAAQAAAQAAQVAASSLFATQIIAAAGLVTALAIFVFIWQAVLARRQVQVALDAAKNSQELLKAAQQQVIASQQQVAAGQEQVKASQQQVIAAQEQIKVAQEQAIASHDQVRAAQEQISITQQQATEQVKEAFEDHERSRREKAIDLLFEWARTPDEAGSDARRFCQKLSLDQIKHLYAFKEVIDESPQTLMVDAKYRVLLNRATSRLHKASNDGTTAAKSRLESITLTQEELLHIRWNLIGYFNLIEAILSAWIHETANKSMIEKEFKFLYENEETVSLIMNFREASDDSCHALAIFTEEMHQQVVTKRQEEEKLAREKEEAERKARFPALGANKTV